MRENPEHAWITNWICEEGVLLLGRWVESMKHYEALQLTHLYILKLTN